MLYLYWRYRVEFNAGIWLHAPHESLLWHRADSRAKMKEVTELDFPSWTWAAYYGEIRYLIPHDNVDPETWFWSDFRMRLSVIRPTPVRN